MWLVKGYAFYDFRIKFWIKLSIYHYFLDLNITSPIQCHTLFAAVDNFALVFPHFWRYLGFFIDLIGFPKASMLGSHSLGLSKYAIKTKSRVLIGQRISAKSILLVTFDRLMFIATFAGFCSTVNWRTHHVHLANWSVSYPMTYDIEFI